MPRTPRILFEGQASCILVSIGPHLNMEARFVENTYTAVVKQDGDCWIGWIEEVPGVNCQEKTKDALLETLQLTLREALEFNRAEAIQAADRDYTEEMITLSVSA